MKTYKIYLIRHGFTEANLKGAYCGSTDLPLCAEGESNLYDILDVYTYPYVDVVYTSPLQRARKTAEILYPDCEQLVMDELREADFGRFEGKTMKELESDPEYCKWVAPTSNYCPDFIEPPKEFFERCAGVLKNIVEDMMKKSVFNAAVITHAGVIGNMLASTAYPKKPPYDWQCEPGCGFCVIADPTLYLREPVVEVVSYIPSLDGQEDEDNGEEYSE